MGVGTLRSVDMWDKAIDGGLKTPIGSEADFRGTGDCKLKAQALSPLGFKQLPLSGCYSSRICAEA
jgi:hypothetical protein